MPVVTCQLAALSSQITRPVNMESVFARREARPGDEKSDTSIGGLGYCFTLNRWLSEYGDRHLSYRGKKVTGLGAYTGPEYDAST